MAKVLIATEKPFAAPAVAGIKEIIEKAGFELALLEKYTEKLIDKDFVCKVPSKSVKDILRKIKDYIKIIIKIKNNGLY